MKFTLDTLMEAKRQLDTMFAEQPPPGTLFGTSKCKQAVVDAVPELEKRDVTAFQYDSIMGIRFIEKPNQIMSGWLISDRHIADAYEQNRISEFDLINMQNDPRLKFIR